MINPANLISERARLFNILIKRLPVNTRAILVDTRANQVGTRADLINTRAMSITLLTLTLEGAARVPTASDRLK